MITNKKECEEAAKFLGLADTDSDEYEFGDRPHGCINKEYQGGSNYLIWATTESHPHPNVPCGTNSFDCICAKYGKKLYF